MVFIIIKIIYYINILNDKNKLKIKSNKESKGAFDNVI